MGTTKVTYQFKKDSPNREVLELATLYTVEFIPENKLMEVLNVSSSTIRNWMGMGLNRYKIGDKKYFRKSEVNGFIEQFLEPQKEVQHVKIRL